MIQILCETVIFISSHTLLKAGNEAWCSYIAVSGCISETLTLLVGSSGRWNISFATVSNPVYREANVSPVKGTWEGNAPIQSQVEPALHSGLQSPKTDPGLFSDQTTCSCCLSHCSVMNTKRQDHVTYWHITLLWLWKWAKDSVLEEPQSFSLMWNQASALKWPFSLWTKHTSAEAPQRCGVPHVSSLGPTLFPLFMLPLRSIIESVKFICL